MTLPVRLIATDIDGTLLNREGKVTDRCLSAIRKAVGRGIVFAIASGRFPENVFVKFRGEGLVCPIIGINGAHIVDEKLRSLQEHYIQRDASIRVQKLLEDAGADYFMFAPHRICSSNPAIRHHSELSNGDDVKELGFSYCRGSDAAREMAKGSVYKYYVCANVPLDPLRAALRGIGSVTVTQSAPMNIEVMPQDVDKGRGVSDLARMLGIPLSQVMTLGDEENDIPMLKIAGFGVAMGNASQAAKAAAKYITATNDEDGLAAAIECYALQED